MDPDTRYYWNLTSNIIRYNHSNGGKRNALAGVHTVNECMSLDFRVIAMSYSKEAFYSHSD